MRNLKKAAANLLGNKVAFRGRGGGGGGGYRRSESLRNSLLW